jgi:predicted neuraminidase
MPKVSLLGYVDTVSESVGMVKLVATLSTPAVGTSTVDLSFSGTATLPSDFTLSKTVFLFNQGQSKDTITVTIVNDLISEPTESVSFSLTNPMGIALDASTLHTLTILDNDASGIMNNEIMKAIAVYPSPAQDGFNIALPYYKENLSVVIVNAEGKMLKQAKLNQGTNAISTEGMATGSYSILFSNDERQIVGLKTIQICK